MREAALVGLLAPAGAGAAEVLAAGLLWELVLVAGGLLGWVVTRASGWNRQDPSVDVPR